MVQNKEDLNRGKGYIKKFCKSLKEHPVEAINFVKKKMIPLTKKSLNHILANKNVIFEEEKLK